MPGLHFIQNIITIYYDFTTYSCNAFTLKEEMRAPVKKVTRIFVARIPQSVTEAAFRRYECVVSSIMIFFFSFSNIFLC